MTPSGSVSYTGGVTAPRAGARPSPTRSSTSAAAGTSRRGTFGREDWRTFRIDRISRPASTGVRFAQRKLPARDAATYVKQSIASAPTRYEAA